MPLDVMSLYHMSIETLCILYECKTASSSHDPRLQINGGITVTLEAI